MKRTTNGTPQLPELSANKDRSLTTIDHWTLPRDLIDQLSLSYQGNQRTTTTDSKTNLAYSGSSEFVKRSTGRYSYNVNGALSKDENRGIDTIKYDLCGNPNKIIFADGSEIEYEYTAEGKKLQTKHKRGRRSGNLIFYEMPEVTTYVGNLVMKDSHPELLKFDGGYASFDHDTIAGLHLYIRDYMGNNRVVANQDGTIEQITHYYPYGGVIGDISTNENLQKFKFEGKELDRTFGLDCYDVEARQYFAMAPMWDRPDSKTEDYYGISPYVYCQGDPVNKGDYDGNEPGRYEEIRFGIMHPIVTTRIGIGVTKGAQNISTNATRFATRENILYGSLSTQEDRGSENGAFRHALWQATITSEFGADIAKQVGDSHENNPNLDMTQKTFKNLDEADQAVDLHNNIIGRNIGTKNVGKGMKNIAIAVIEEFMSNGLYVAVRNSDGYVIVKKKLDYSKYNKLTDIFNQLNNNGRYEYEQQDYDQQKSDEARRNNTMQNTM